ncbi:acetyltransferase [Alkalihalophilus pseudofirmus OF4]|uniref:Acetyltransferase n=1 Tax=Alkalihalophilus pseudofirmus (strain ATCC BAA-2126 / JCM 17055 / OF4) TaxID=398511 RepID=D3FSB9_ALKPO|nr:GNAT family N-acetyltransferase [Alkalihalophilus pseudofirmus]ADC51754.1 acetyltransferase [Alkalihalophilus pseudofirmus OF4]
MNIKILQSEQYIEAINLSEYAFQYKVSKERIEELKERMHQHHIVYGIDEEEKLASKLHLLPHHIYLQGNKWKMGGVAGVATYPEYRRSGHVKALLHHSLCEMREKGMTISMLHPFSVPFYRTYGWELFTNRLITTLKKSDLKRIGNTAGSIKRFTTEEEHPDLTEVYNTYASQFSGMLIRVAYWWKTVVKDMNIAVYYDKAKSPKGYLLYTVKDSKMDVEEFIALDAEARTGLWNFICQHDSMVEEVSLTTHEREPLFFAIDEPRVKAEVKPYFMVRIVDVEEFIANYEWGHTKLAEPLTIHVTDSFAEWNNQSFLFNKKGVKSQKPNKEGVTLTIQSLAALCFGYKSPAELKASGLLDATEEQLNQLEQLIPQSIPYFYDFF